MNQSDTNDTTHLLLDFSSDSLKKYAQWGLNLLNVVGFLLAIYLLYWGFRNQIFTSNAALRNLLDMMGAAAPLGFIFIQIVQTVVPVIPGALTIPMGTMVFGMGFGFVLNFTGIMIGSVLNFLLARRFGRPLVELLVNQQKFEKYTRWLDDEERFEKGFIFGMFFPLSPADLLCYIAGLSKLPFNKYLLILSLGKPLTLFLYSVGMTEILNFAFQLLA